MVTELTPPWLAFLRDLDSQCDHPVVLHCCGGFVMTAHFGLARSTADLDVISVVPGEDLRHLATLGQRGSSLHARHGVYLDVVTVSTLPEGYQDRITPMFPGTFHHLSIMALDPYDLALSKLERNADRDRSDVMFLAATVPLDPDTLTARYLTEMRGYLGRPDREDLTLELWVEMIRETSSGPR